MSESEVMTQTAPYPTALKEMVDRCRFRPGWIFRLSHLARDRDLETGEAIAEGLTLVITTLSFNSYHRPVQPTSFMPGDTCIDCGEPFPCSAYAADKNNPKSPRFPYRVNHYMPVPAATYNRESWRWWLFEQCKRVDDHEAMEFFEIEGEGRPYAPNHGPGWDPYLVTEVASDVDRRTKFTGELNPA